MSKKYKAKSETPEMSNAELFKALSKVCEGQPLTSVLACLTVLTARAIAAGSNDRAALHGALLQFAFRVHDETLDIAEAIGVGETRQ